MDGQMNMLMITVSIGIGNSIGFVVASKRWKDGWTDFWFPGRFHALFNCNSMMDVFWCSYLVPDQNDTPINMDMNNGALVFFSELIVNCITSWNNCTALLALLLARYLIRTTLLVW
jgi:hypothetical protein